MFEFKSKSRSISVCAPVGRRRFIKSVSAALVGPAVLGTPTVWAQAQRLPIRILVGFPAGGTIDVTGRLLADQLKNELGATVIVDSKPGAGGQIAAQALKQSAPDGRTLLLSPDHTMVMIPLTLKTPGFSPLADFAPVAQVARYAGGFAVAGHTGARNLDEFFAWVRRNPQQGNVGVPAPGSIPQFFVYKLGETAKLALVSAPYRGSAPLVQDLIGGQLGAGTTALGDFMEHHTAGKLRVVAVLGDKRAAALPGVPTFSEQGFPVQWDYWLGLFAPAGTASAEVLRINAAVARVLGRADVRERMAKIVFEPVHSSPEDLTRLVRAGTAYWEPIVRSSGWALQ